MGLLPGDVDSDAKYNVVKEEKPKKNWIKTVLIKKTKRIEADSASDKKIDTNGFLKKEDKNDI
jgi:hypothetical protein